MFVESKATDTSSTPAGDNAGKTAKPAPAAQSAPKEHSRIQHSDVFDMLFWGDVENATDQVLAGEGGWHREKRRTY